MARGLGRVVFYDPKANYGFIDPADGGGDISFSIQPYDDKVDVDDYVYFDLIPQLQVTTIGRQAIRVWRAVGIRPEPETPQPEVVV
jgi:hypothetical protein